MRKTSAGGASAAGNAKASTEMEVVHTFAKNRFDEVWTYLQPYRSRELAHIRVMTLGDDDEMHFTARGISINIKYLPQLQEAVTALVAAVEARSQ